ncbi:MAG: polymer-forming cytoskeletal protein [Bacteroidota bacterium]
MALGKKKTEETMANSQENNVDSRNSFANGTEISGEIKSSGNVRIDGKLKGNINIKGRLVIGATGFVEGDIVCNDCDVLGKVVGKINVLELLSLKASANIQGDMITKKLSIEPGAKFTGTCKMDEKQGIQSFTEKTETKDKSPIK